MMKLLERLILIVGISGVFIAAVINLIINEIDKSILFTILGFTTWNTYCICYGVNNDQTKN